MLPAKAKQLMKLEKRIQVLEKKQEVKKAADGHVRNPSGCSETLTQCRICKCARNAESFYVRKATGQPRGTVCRKSCMEKKKAKKKKKKAWQCDGCQLGPEVHCRLAYQPKLWLCHVTFGKSISFSLGSLDHWRQTNSVILMS